MRHSHFYITGRLWQISCGLTRSCTCLQHECASRYVHPSYHKVHSLRASCHFMTHCLPKRDLVSAHHPIYPELNQHVHSNRAHHWCLSAHRISNSRLRSRSRTPFRSDHPARRASREDIEQAGGAETVRSVVDHYLQLRDK